ncbi:MAG: hypothetical protein H8D22_09245 [Candidatus Cloacimonetes bacterium]|nr:hypothetical protein [Candidatus Cloacimonadota bacterium]
MIKNCFMDEQPNFLSEVKLDGVKIATIKALSRKDRAEIEDKCMKKTITDGKIEVNINFEKMQYIRMLLSLKSWELDRDITLENIALLMSKQFKAIDEAIQKMESDWNSNKEDIEKNLKKQSG